jgi:signal transduction histidine kinase
MHLKKNTVGTSWKVLIVDGRSTVHQSTKLLLKKISFAGKGIQLLSSFYLEEAKKTLQKEHDIALVLIEAKINRPSFGLDLIEYIKKELQNNKIQIILRTGYPDSLPKKEITNKYEIDGCLSEEETSKDQFEFTIVGALQTYNQLITVSNYLRAQAGSIAHEMLNPLNQVQQSLSIVKNEISFNREIFPKEDLEVIDQTLENGLRVCDRANKMIAMILQNIKEDKINTDSFVTLRIAQVVKKAIDEFAFVNEKSKKAVQLNLKQDFEFKGDETLLVYVLFNLLKNSLYFLSIQPDLKVSIRLKKQEGVNTLFFKDTGVGIPKDKLATIFDNFMTADKKGGTGLGLGFCKRVMISFEGGITCKSEVSKWTEFELTFPHYN